MKPRFLHLSLATCLLLAVSLAEGCGTDACACSPPETVVGTYQATRFRATPTGQATIDALAAGATITLTLSTSGTTSGTFFVPASLNNGVAVSLNLAGTYQTSGAQVTFSHSADTFIRDVPWQRSGSTLVTTSSAGGAQYDVILTRQ